MTKPKKEKITGYKVFNHDWTCRGFKYEIGKTYTREGEKSLCYKGFHFCKNLMDCFDFYDCVTWNKIAKVEALGEVKTDNKKCVTNKIKILEEIPFDKIGEYVQNDLNTAVNLSDGVNLSNGVNGSDGVNGSNGVNESKGVNKSDGVNWSNGVNKSNGVNVSNGVNKSDGVNWSNGVNLSDGVNWSNGVNESYGVNESKGVNLSYGILNSYGVSNALFLANKTQTYTIFGKNVTKEKFNEVWKIFHKKLNGWVPTFNNLKSLYLKSGSSWKLTPIPNAEEISKKEAWESMPKKAIEYIKTLEEFDKDMFEEITGIEV